MKRFWVLFTCAVLMIPLLAAPCAQAVNIAIDYDSMAAEDLRQIISDAQAALERKQGGADAQSGRPAAQQEAIIACLGDRGETVKEIQSMLVDLGMLKGTPDGVFGNGTEAGVKLFQKKHGFEQTGIVMQSDYDAMKQAVAALPQPTEAPAATAEPRPTEAPAENKKPRAEDYTKLDYKSVARNPSAYEGQLICFAGRVVQVQESGKTAVFRIATKDKYDDVVYCTYTIPDNYSRILEEDDVRVYGVCTGIYTYETIFGASVTIPSCKIDHIVLK